jgi:hypothetical protein
MTDQELLVFVVDCLTEVYRQEGMTIKNTNKTIGIESPNFVMESGKGRSYYVFVDCFTFPTPKSRFDQSILSEFRRIAKAANAIPMVASVGVFCFDTNGAPAICGGTFALKYDHLQTIESPRTFWSKLFWRHS